VNQLFERLDKGAPRPVLTGRQWEIVALIAQGMTNQAIADRLGVERLTVSQHVATILWQLGLQGRHEIAAWAMLQSQRT